MLHIQVTGLTGSGAAIAALPFRYEGGCDAALVA
jgi:hypothetical protein